MAVPTATQSVVIGKSDSTKSSGRQFLGDTGPFTNGVSSDFIDSDFRHSPSMAIDPVVTPSVVKLEAAACLTVRTRSQRYFIELGYSKASTEYGEARIGHSEMFF